MTGDGKGRVAELPLTTAHPTVVTATGDDDGDGGAAAPEMAGGGGHDPQHDVVDVTGLEFQERMHLLEPLSTLSVPPRRTTSTSSSSSGSAFRGVIADMRLMQLTGHEP
ncbi:hypothetical protein [Oryza sativa Japonica Group]|uniref:DUF834 domain-containing protein n=1 Tax=Oryza sativa subsp. japonica TaxID=39947 RepID=Q5N9N6_ORYSJ|nr:hypothetical protein [Oryza sativa Japonica Group]